MYVSQNNIYIPTCTFMSKLECSMNYIVPKSRILKFFSVSNSSFTCHRNFKLTLGLPMLLYKNNCRSKSEINTLNFTKSSMTVVYLKNTEFKYYNWILLAESYQYRIIKSIWHYWAILFRTSSKHTTYFWFFKDFSGDCWKYGANPKE